MTKNKKTTAAQDTEFKVGDAVAYRTNPKIKVGHIESVIKGADAYTADVQLIDNSATELNVPFGELVHFKAKHVKATTKPKAKVDVIDMNALGKKAKAEEVTVPPINQEITSLFSMTPEALASIIQRWRNSAGHKAITSAKARLLKCNPPPALVRRILDGACQAYDDSGLGGMDSRVLYTELAKGINDEALNKAIDSCNLNRAKLEFTYDDNSDMEAGKLSAMWVLHPAFGEHVLNVVIRRYKGVQAMTIQRDATTARRGAMLSMLTRDPNRLIEPILTGRVSKQAVADLKKWAGPSGKPWIGYLGNRVSVTLTKVALVRAAVWPEDMLKAIVRDYNSSWTQVFANSTNSDTILHWWPTRTSNSRSVYEETVNGKPIYFADLMLVASMGVLFDKINEEEHAFPIPIVRTSPDIIDGLLSKLPPENDPRLMHVMWRTVITLAYRHEHMERIVHHLAKSWKGFAEAALSDESAEWFVDTLPRLRGRMPGIINRSVKANRQGKVARLAAMLRVIHDARPDLHFSLGLVQSLLSKWVKTGVTKTSDVAADSATAKQFFLPKAIGSNLVTEDMVALASGLKGEPNAARDMLPTIDTDVLRGLLAHATTEFVLYLYSLDPMLLWAIEYQRAFDARSKQTRDKIRKLLPKWLLGVTNEQDVREADWT